MVNNITANDLKVKGVSILDQMTADQNEAIITVRGKSKYVVLTIDEYNYLRECELEAALVESRKDLQNGDFHSDSIEEHLKRIKHA
ncbi:MAG: prevent-host-death protein [Spirochaetaceae bacterium]|nr:prevent-host-death protein [Spirochaetaceae bacterium]